MAKLLNIYLPPLPGPQFGKYEIYRDGKPTGEIIDNAVVRKILTADQFKDFINGDDIFYVPAEKFRKRKHKTKSLPLSGKEITFTKNNNQDGKIKRK